MNAVQLTNADDTSANFVVDDSIAREVSVLKELTWCYIIERPSLATIQRGQRDIIRELFDLFATGAKEGDLRLFPPSLSDSKPHKRSLGACGSPSISLLV